MRLTPSRRADSRAGGDRRVEAVVAAAELGDHGDVVAGDAGLGDADAHAHRSLL